MNFILKSIFTSLFIAFGLNLYAQDTVVPAKNPDDLFISKDKELHRNKQVAYHIVKDLLESNHWELAHKYIDENYIQHNPNAANGRKALVNYFTEVLKLKPTPIADKMKSKVVSVVAEGDLVTVAFVKEEKDPKDPNKTYTTTWFDQWRFKEGKAIEHWDNALKAF